MKDILCCGGCCGGAEPEEKWLETRAARFDTDDTLLWYRDDWEEKGEEEKEEEGRGEGEEEEE